MAELKTRSNTRDAGAFIASLEDAGRRADCEELLGLFRDITGHQAAMWGDSIIGFDSYHYRYQSGHEGDWFVTGFSPRKQNLTLYVMPGFDGFEDLLARLGPHKLGKSCLYVKNLQVVDREVLIRLLTQAYRRMKRRYPS